MHKNLLIAAFALLLAAPAVGQNWTWTNTNGPYGGAVNDIAVTGGTTFLAATSTGLFRSTDSGANWNKVTVNGNFTTQPYVDIEVAGGTIYLLAGFYNASGTLYSSTDGGANWTILTATGINSPITNYRRMEVSLSGKIYIAPSNSMVLIRSTDNGASFSQLPTTFSSNINDVDTDSGNRVVVATQSHSTWVSTNDGISFSAPSSGLSAAATVYSTATIGGGIYCMASDGPYRSLTAGASLVWTPIKGNIADVTFTGFIEADGSNLYLTNTTSFIIYTLSTPASSTTWTASASYNTSNTNQALTGYFENATTWYLSRNGTGIDKTPDGGASWSSYCSGMTGIIGSKIFRTSGGRLLYAFNNGMGYFLSIDDGNTWNLINSGNANRQISNFILLSDASVLAYGSGGVIRTVDQGNNWTVQSATSIFNGIASADGTNLYYFTGVTINKSIDKGVTWTSIGAITGLPAGSINKMVVDNPGNIYLKFFNSGASAYELWKIPSATTTASKVTIPFTPLNDLQTVGNNIYILGSTLLSKSVDGGTNWTNSNVISGSFTFWAVDDNNIYVQAFNSFQTTTNGGGSFTVRNINGVNPGNVSDLLITTGEVLFVSTNYARVQKSSTPVIPPVAPTGLTLNGRGVQTVQVVWNDNATNETDYIPEYSIGNNTSWQVNSFTAGVVSGPQHKRNLPLPADSLVTYYYRIRAVNLAGYSAYSNEISATGLCNYKSTIPDNRSWTATAVADPGSTASGPGPFTNATVAVSKVTNSKNNFTVSVYAMGVTPLAIHPATTTATFAELCGQTYFQFGQPGYDFTHGNGTWDPVNKIIVLKWQSDNDSYNLFEGTTTLTLNVTDPIPTTPTLTGTVFSGTKNAMIWTRSSFASQYVIERSTVSNTFSGPPLATVNDPTIQYFDGAGITSGTTYYYRVTAKNSAGSSAPSAQVSITPPTSSLFSPLENDISLNTDSQQGISWGDMDGDGDEDYLSSAFQNSGGQPASPTFYENINGTGQFNRRSLDQLINENLAVYRGGHLADMNNDGRLDVYLVRTSGSTVTSDLVLINNGGWNFTKLAPPGQEATQFKGVTLIDYDRDGLVDFASGSTDVNSSGVGNTFLFHNTTTGGATSFGQVSSAGDLTTNLSSTRDVSAADFDNDGLEDLLITSYNTNPTTPNPNIPNRVFKNNGDGTFTVISGSAMAGNDNFLGCRTSSWGDIDNDGDLDLFLGSATGSAPKRLYQNNGNGTFTYLSGSVVAAETTTATFGSAFGDIDNDGDLDLILVNLSGGNSIYQNDGTGNFVKYTGIELLTSTTLANIGGAFVDYDKNGFLDFSPGRSTGVIPPCLYNNNLTASASRNWIEIKLVGTVSNRAAIGARIKVITASPARTQIREVSSRTGYSSMSSLIQHFGLGTATSISQIQVRWPNGGTQTWNSPAAGQTMNQVVTITEDVTGPTLSFTPANGATGVTLGNTITVTLSEPGTPQAAKNITVRKGTSTSTPLQTILATAGVAGGGNSYTYTLAANLEALTTYFISVDAGSFNDAFGNNSLAVLPTNWSFITIDNISPVITFTAPATLPKAGITGQVLSVTATDNISIASVVMSYKKITATQYQTLNGVFNAATSKYDFPLQATYFDDMGMEYYYTATDPSNNSARSPATGTHVTRLTFPASTIAVGVPAGSTANDYKIISIPLDLATTNIANIFTDFGAPDITQWRLLKYQHSPQDWLQYPNSFSAIARGEGYFILSRQGKNLQFNGATAPTFSQTSLFSLNLAAGFNLIGNPYTMPIDWEDTRTGVSGVNAIKVFSGGNYSDGNTIDVFSGGFVFANAAVTVTVKLKTSLNGGRTGPSLPASRIDDEEWIVPILMTEGQRQFNLGGVGMSPKAHASYDDLDDFAPPSLTGEFEISFAHPEHFMKKFSRDVVLTQPGHTWSFTVQSDSHLNATLRWDNYDFKESGTDLFLFDVAMQRPVDMRNENSYQFDPSVSKEFRVYFGTDARDQLKPERLFIGHAFPNPASGVVNIPFNLPESTVDLSAKVEILDAMGRTVETILNTTLPSGFYTASWDAGASTVVDGFYIVRVAASYDGKQQTVSTKLIVHK